MPYEPIHTCQKDSWRQEPANEIDYETTRSDAPCLKVELDDFGYKAGIEAIRFTGLNVLRRRLQLFGRETHYFFASVERLRQNK